MKKTNYLLLGCISFLLAGTPPARAQAPDELQAFQQAAGDRSALFRGRQAVRYTFQVNGNPYWYFPDFERGDILCEGNFYRDVPINIDAREQRALVQLSSGVFAVALSPAQAPSFTMGKRRFIGAGPGEALPEGFYEVFGNGPEHVYKHVVKYLNSSVANMNGDPIGYYDPDYKSHILRYFALRATYYFQDADGNISRFKGRGALLRKFPGRRKEIRQALQAAGMDRSSIPFDSYCEAVLNSASAR